MRNKCLNIFFTTSIFFSSTMVYAETSSWPSRSYLGVNFGSVWGKTKNTLLIANDLTNPYFYSTIPGVNDSGTSSINQTKFTAGTQMGYNINIKNDFIAGLEVSYDYINLYRSFGGMTEYTTLNGQYNLSTSISVRQMGTLRPRLGFIVKKFLPYITGGLAVTNLRFNQAFSEYPYSVENTQSSSTKFGYTLGAGLEYALFDKISLKAEYLNSNFGKTSAAGNLMSMYGNATFNNSLSSLNIQTLLLGINVHFA